MKILLTVILILCINASIDAQEDYRISKPQRAIKPTISVPKLLDGDKLIFDIKQLKILKDIYFKLKSDTVGNVYLYAFYINEKGKVILGRPESEKLFKGINSFVESKFVRYRWLPAHKLGCKRCFVKTNGVLTFDFDPEKQHILCYIDIMNEKIYKAFYKTINMK